MAFSPAFTVSQSSTTPASLTVNDTSTGSDAAIFSRRVYVSQSDGTYLTGNGTVNYTSWALVDSSITLNILTQDIGASITVEWLDVSGNVRYSSNSTFPLSEFNKQFLYYLVQQQGLTPSIVQDTNYSSNLSVFYVNIVAGINAVTYGNDISACQDCFTRSTCMRLNENNFF